MFEIVRLCALWDRAEADKENIPTIVELIDHADIIEALAQETLAHWSETGGYTPSNDPELDELAEEGLQRSNEAFGQRQAQKTRDELRNDAPSCLRDSISRTRSGTCHHTGRTGALS